MLLLCVLIVSTNSLAQAQEEPVFSVAEATSFGYTDDTGALLLSLDLDNTDEGLDAARRFVAAACMDGSIRPVTHQHYQQANAANTHRDVAGNLPNSAGHLFVIGDGGAGPDQSCLLLPANFRQTWVEKIGEAAGMALSSSRREWLETRSGRDVESYTSLFHARGMDIGAVYFSPLDQDLLGAIALFESVEGLDHAYLYEMPATLDEYSCWKVDDGCEFQPGSMQVPFVFGSEQGGRFVFFVQDGYESQSLVLFGTANEELIAIMRSGRYWLPH